jgi:DMSO/TMAO reductase YedYZ heme-binding membrane subunit
VNRIEKISSLLGDVALPLFGYFFWNWNFYFILLFFMLDQISRMIFLPQRLKLTEITITEKNKIFFRQLALLIIELLVIHSAIFMYQKDINFAQEFISFLSYEDMGIAQGIILLPLIVASEWMRIKNELKLGIVDGSQLHIMNLNKRNSFLRIGFFALLVGFQSFIPLPEVVFVFSFLSLITGLVFI